MAAENIIIIISSSSIWGRGGIDGRQGWGKQENLAVRWIYFAYIEFHTIAIHRQLLLACHSIEFCIRGMYILRSKCMCICNKSGGKNRTCD